MNCFSYIILAGLSIVSAIAITREDAPFCAQKPVVNLLEPPTCGLHQDTPLHSFQHTGTRINGVSDMGWDGPHKCVKDFCLYSNRGYSGGRGIVAITQGRFLPSLNNMHHDPKTRAANTYRVEQILGKGLGVVANRRMERGEAIMPFTPVFLVYKELFKKDYHNERYLDLLEEGVKYLPKYTQRQFLGLMAHPCGHHIRDICFSNGYQVLVSSGYGWGRHTGIYPEVARLNHDCRPNLVYHIGDNLVFRGSVARPILAGEEITVSYLYPLQKWKQRQEQTRHSWRFRCRCSLCALPKILRDESDRRLDRIDSLQQRLQLGDPDTTMDHVREFIHRHREERLDTTMASALVLAAQKANEMGYKKEAKEYADMAVEAELLERGASNSWESRELKALIEGWKPPLATRKREKETKVREVKE